MTLEDKKIYFYAGRSHHVQRLDGIVQSLAAAGADCIWLTSDNYLNFDPNSMHLIQSGKKFVHGLEYFPSGVSGNVVAAASQVLSEIKGEWAGDIRSYVDPFYLVSSVHEFCETLLCFDQFLQREKPDLVSVLHGGNAWGNLLAYLCKAHGVPCLGYMEGALRARDQETQGKQSLAAEYVSHLCVWSEAAKESYLAAGVPAEKLYVTGVPHLDPWLNQQKPAKAGKLVAFCPPLVSRYEGDLGKAISQLSEWAQKNKTALLIRMHPFDGQDVGQQVRQQLIGNPFVQVYDEDTLSLLSIADVVISQHSTVAVEALALGVPLVELDLDGVGVLESLAEQGAAVSVGAGQLDRLNQILEGKLVPANLREWRSRNLGLLDSRSVERVVNVIDGILN